MLDHLSDTQLLLATVYGVAYGCVLLWLGGLWVTGAIRRRRAAGRATWASDVHRHLVDTRQRDQALAQIRRHHPRATLRPGYRSHEGDA